MVGFYNIIRTWMARPATYEVEEHEAAPLQGGNILIGVQPNDAIWMAGRQMEMREVRQAVERARSENPGSSVVIVADQGARIGTVTQVMDQARLAGVEGVAISARRAVGD